MKILEILAQATPDSVITSGALEKVVDVLVLLLEKLP